MHVQTDRGVHLWGFDLGLVVPGEIGELLQYLDLAVHHSQHAAVEGPLLGQLFSEPVVKDGQLLEDEAAGLLRSSCQGKTRTIVTCKQAWVSYCKKNYLLLSTSFKLNLNYFLNTWSYLLNK